MSRATPARPSNEVGASGRHGRGAGLLAVIAAALCFSVSSSIAKWAETTGTVIAFWRMLAAAGVWWLILMIQRLRRGRRIPPASSWRKVAVPGLLFGANLAIFFTAVNRTSIAHAEFIGAMTPLVLLPAGALLFGEHPNWRALAWGLVSVLGVLIVLGFGPAGGPAGVDGDLLVGLAVLTWAAYLLFTKRAREGLDVVEFMACVTPIALLTSGPIAVLTAADDMFPLSGRAWLVVGMLTLLTGVGAHGLIVFAQRHVPVATIGVVQVGQPALAVVWSFLILGETIRAPQIPGMILVVLGLALFTYISQERSAAPLLATAPPLDEA